MNEIPFIFKNIEKYFHFSDEKLNQIYFRRYIIRIPYRVQVALFFISVIHWFSRVRFPFQFYSLYETFEWILFTIGWIIPQVIMLTIAQIKNTENKAMNAHKSYSLKLFLSRLHRFSCVSLASALGVLLMDKARYGVCHRQTIYEYSVCRSENSVLAIPADHSVIVIITPILMQLFLKTDRYTTFLIWLISFVSVIVAVAVTNSFHGYLLIVVCFATIFVLIENERSNMNAFLVEYIQRLQMLKSSYGGMEALDLSMSSMYFEANPSLTREIPSNVKVHKDSTARAIRPINLDEELVLNFDNVYELKDIKDSSPFKSSTVARKQIVYDVLFGYLQLKPHLHRPIKEFLDANISTGSSLLGLQEDQCSDQLSISSLTDSLNRYKKYSYCQHQVLLSFKRACMRDDDGSQLSDMSEDEAYRKLFRQLEDLKRKLHHAKILPPSSGSHDALSSSRSIGEEVAYSCGDSSSITSANTAIKLQDPLHHQVDYIDPELGLANAHSVDQPTPMLINDVLLRERQAFLNDFRISQSLSQLTQNRHLIDRIPTEHMRPWLQELLQGEALSVETILELYDRVVTGKQVLESSAYHDLALLLQEEIVHVSC